MAFRKHPPVARPTRKVQMLASQGSVPTTVIPRRRLGLQIETSKVRQLGAFFGTPSAGGSVGSLIWWQQYGQGANV
jgi:hypothetical protein